MGSRDGKGTAQPRKALGQGHCLFTRWTHCSCSTVDVFSLFELPTFRELRAFTSHTGFRNYLDGHQEAITSLTFSPDGRTAVSGCMDHTIRLYQVASGKALGALLGHSGAIKSVAFSPDNRTILSSSEDTTLKLWDFATGKELRTFTGHWHEFSQVTYRLMATLSFLQRKSDTQALGRRDRQRVAHLHGWNCPD